MSMKLSKPYSSINKDFFNQTLYKINGVWFVRNPSFSTPNLLTSFHIKLQVCFSFKCLFFFFFEAINCSQSCAPMHFVCTSVIALNTSWLVNVSFYKSFPSCRLSTLRAQTVNYLPFCTQGCWVHDGRLSKFWAASLADVFAFMWDCH